MTARVRPQEEIFALRQAIARIEGKSIHAARLVAEPRDVLEPGDVPAHAESRLQPAEEAKRETPENPAFDVLLAQARQPGTMLEIRGQRLGEAGAASGFALALALSLRPPAPAHRYILIGDPQVTREAGLPYAPGLADFGILPGQLIHALPKRIEDALWLADAALACGAFSVVLLEVHGNSRRFGLTESRRLSLKTRGSGGALILLRQAGEEEASSASLRLKVEPASASPRNLHDGTMLGGSIGHPVFRVLAEKSRPQVLSEFTLEWNSHDRRLRPLSRPEPAEQSRRATDPVAAFSAPFDRSAGPAPLGTVVAFDRAS